MAYKVCFGCKKAFSNDKFYYNKITKTFSSCYCKKCHKNKSRIWRAKNRDKYRNYRLKFTYGVDANEYQKRYKNQNGCCAICQNPNLSGKWFNVDHDHKTGKVRGLLCDCCNWLLGNAKDNIGTLQRAVDYLEGVVPLHG